MKDLPTGSEKRKVVQTMFDTIAPRYDMLNRVLTLRLDVRWRRKMVKDLGLAPQSIVIDLACGTGDICNELKASGYTAMGFDLSMGMLGNATCPESPLTHADILSLPLFDGSTDGATCGFALRNLVAIPQFFTELARVVRPGGRIALLEVDSPSNPLLKKGHSIYFERMVPAIGAALSDRAAYQYLPKSVSYLPSAEELISGLNEAGFKHVKHQRLAGGIAQLFTATRGR